MTAPLAHALINKGHHVTGSDQNEIYPPISDLITDIPINQPLGKIDLVIVGSSYKSFRICVDQFEKIKKLKIPYISATEYIAQNLIKTESILVAGSYGKTTITAALSFLMPESNYFFGGIPVDNTPSLQLSDSPWSIVEADESINGLDTKAKFLYYKTKYVIITSTSWEHKDSYKTATENLNAFKQLIKNIPIDGVLVYNQNDKDIQKLLPYCRAKSLPYTNNVFNTKLIGRHNQENLNAAYTLCHYLNIPFEIQAFSGIKRRLEIIFNKNNILVIDDFAQSANRVKSALEAIKYSYPHRPLKIFFESHASFLQNSSSIADFETIYPLCQEFILSKIIFSKDKNQRISSANWQSIFKEKYKYLPLKSDLETYLKNSIQPNDILVHFSSGGLEGQNILKRVYN